MNKANPRRLAFEQLNGRLMCAADIYLSTTGKDSGPHDAGQPFKTFDAATKALAAAGDGSTLYIADGRFDTKGKKLYLDDVTIDGSPSTVLYSGKSADYTLNLYGYGFTVQDVIVEGGSKGIRLYNVDYAHFQNITVRKTDVEAIHLRANSEWNTFDTITIYDTGRADASNGGGIVVGTAPEYRSKYPIDGVTQPDKCSWNTFTNVSIASRGTAFSVREDSNWNTLESSRVTSSTSGKPVVEIRGSKNVLDTVTVENGKSDGVRFVTQTIVAGKYGQPATKTYGADNTVRNSTIRNNAGYGVYMQIGPQLLESNVIAGNKRGAVRNP